MYSSNYSMYSTPFAFARVRKVFMTLAEWLISLYTVQYINEKQKLVRSFGGLEFLLSGKVC